MRDATIPDLCARLRAALDAPEPDADEVSRIVGALTGALQERHGGTGWHAWARGVRERANARTAGPREAVFEAGRIVLREAAQLGARMARDRPS